VSIAPSSAHTTPSAAAAAAAQRRTPLPPGVARLYIKFPKIAGLLIPPKDHAERPYWLNEAFLELERSRESTIKQNLSNVNTRKRAGETLLAFSVLDTHHEIAQTHFDHFRAHLNTASTDKEVMRIVDRMTGASEASVSHCLGLEAALHTDAFVIKTFNQRIGQSYQRGNPDQHSLALQFFYWETGTLLSDANDQLLKKINLAVKNAPIPDMFAGLRQDMILKLYEGSFTCCQAAVEKIRVDPRYLCNPIQITEAEIVDIMRSNSILQLRRSEHYNPYDGIPGAPTAAWGSTTASVSGTDADSRAASDGGGGGGGRGKPKPRPNWPTKSKINRSVEGPNTEWMKGRACINCGGQNHVWSCCRIVTGLPWDEKRHMAAKALPGGHYCSSAEHYKLKNDHFAEYLLTDRSVANNIWMAARWKRHNLEKVAASG
jgi:hypothetical protein